jgi:hypothetical protein
MTARLFCVFAAALGSSVGACLPVASEDEKQENALQAASESDVPLEIAISYFPGAYQGRWATTATGCADDPENSQQMISLQGKLLKSYESIGTMTAGKRQTSKTMEAEFEFIGEGTKWNKAVAFELSQDRSRLIKTDKGDGTSVRYVQCPKLMAG